jgi:hypothetical protein
MANDSFYTMTPGSAVADQLQDILTRKATEKRQAMLDDLNRRNIESEMSTREDNAATNSAYRQGLTEQHEARIGQINATTAENARRQAALKNFKIPDDVPLAVKAQLQLSQQTGDWEGLKEALRTLGQQPKSDTHQGGSIWTMGPNGPYNTGEWMNPGDQFHAPLPDRTPEASKVPQLITMDMPNDPNRPEAGTHKETRWVKPGQPFEKGVQVGASLAVRNERPSAPPKPPQAARTPSWPLFAQAVDKVLKGDTRVEGDLNAQAAKIAQEMNIPPHVSEGVLAAFHNAQNRGRKPRAFLDANGQPLSPQENQAAQLLWNTLTGGFQPQSPQ